MTWLLPVAVLIPIVLAAPAMHPRLRWTPALAALPALAAAWVVPLGESLDLPWLLLGARFGLDEVGRIFLVFTAILWIAAGIYAVAGMRRQAHAGRFGSLFLLAMAGNLWLIVAQDLPSFYVGFALMGLSSYGLVIHDGDRAAVRAGTLYLVLTLGAEVVLFVALVTIASTTGSLHPTPDDLVELSDATIGLLVLAFAVKAGLVPLHIWLPLAHPAAPIPASAVLSGAMIKVALLGWLRFLPVGEIALPGWGLLFVFAGLATALYAVPIGLVQSNPKVLLAYSSVGKMGLMVVTLGFMLVEPGIAPIAAVGLALYAGHHALAKGGLFLGVGLRKSPGPQPLILGGIVLLALSMAAVPLTSGAVAKYGIKPALGAIDWPWLTAAIALGTMATAWLMARLIWVILGLRPPAAALDGHPAGHRAGGIAARIDGKLLGWIPLVVLVLLYPLVFGSPTAWLTDGGLIAAALLIALPILIAARHRPALLNPLIDSIKPGDLVGWVRPLVAAGRWGLVAIIRVAHDALVARVADFIRWVLQAMRRPPSDLDRRLTDWSLAGGLWLIILMGLVGLTGAPPLDILDATREPPLDIQRLDQPLAPAPAGAPEPVPGPPDPIPSAEPVTTEPAVQSEIGSPGPDPGTADLASPAAPSPELAPEPPQEALAAEPAVTPAPASDHRACDPADIEVFAHAPSGESVSLKPCVEVDGEPRRIASPPLSNALVRLIQRHLADRGFDPGPIDGLIGPATRDAIRRFQTDRGLRATGAVTFDLLDELGAVP